jgi:hypothetical protein
MGSFSIWHWLIVLFVLAVPGTIIYIAVKRARADGAVMTAGFKGWLFIFATTQWIGVLRALSSFVQVATDKSESTSRFPLLSAVDLVATGAVLALAALALILMLKRSAAFPAAFLWFCAVAVLSLPTTLVVGVTVLNSAYGIPVTMAQGFEASPVSLGAWVGAVFGAGLWVAYVLRSRRVVLTFVN